MIGVFFGGGGGGGGKRERLIQLLHKSSVTPKIEVSVSICVIV